MLSHLAAISAAVNLAYSLVLRPPVLSNVVYHHHRLVQRLVQSINTRRLGVKQGVTYVRIDIRRRNVCRIIATLRHTASKNIDCRPRVAKGYPAPARIFNATIRAEFFYGTATIRPTPDGALDRVAARIPMS